MNKLLLFILLSSSIFLTSCKHTHEPTRIKNIPESAMWVGGPDGGVWIACAYDEAKLADWCTVYDDQDGHVQARCYFVLENTGRGLPAEELELKYNYFNGLFIGLTDGRKLEPLARYQGSSLYVAPIEQRE